MAEYRKCRGSLGPSINYVVPKSPIFNPLSPTWSVFLLSNIGDFWLPSAPHPLPRRHSLWTAPYIYYVKWSVAWWWLVKSFMLERSVILWSFIENLCASAWLMPYIYTLCPFLGFTFQNNYFLSELSFQLTQSESIIFY